MGTVAGSVDFVRVPEDYDEMYRIYYTYVVAMVHKLGIDYQHKEDVACEIFLRLIERDILALFDDKYPISHGGRKYEPRFKSFLSAQVEHYVRGKRERQTTQKRRELLICDQAVGDGSSKWVEVFGKFSWDDYSGLEEQELVDNILDHLRTVPRRSPRDVCDLARLFQSIVMQVRETGKFNVPKLQAEFGVSSTAIHSWLKELRPHVKEAMSP